MQGLEGERGMPTQHERLQAILGNLRRQQEQQAEAESLWKRALPRCEALARSLVEMVQAQGIKVSVWVEDGELCLALPDRVSAKGEEIGARAVFRFNRQGRSLEGWRTPHVAKNEKAQEEAFFSLTVAVKQVVTHANEFGPSALVETQVTPGTKEAFEEAVVKWLEWALVGNGCSGEQVRLP